jgi:sugar lactone lactonase YvrE
MKQLNLWQALMLLATLVLAAACTLRPAPRTFVTGLNQPRGMAFDENGNLYVAEVGVHNAPRVGEPSGNINYSGRILRISPDRQVTPTVEGLPYTYYPETGDSGAADVAWLGGALYVLTGEGYDDALSRAVLRLRPTDAGAPQPIASLLNFSLGMATSQELQMGIVSSNPYAMVAGEHDAKLYVSDGASGRIFQITPEGDIRVFAEWPMMPLAGMAFGPDGRLYVALFSLRPHTPGSGEVWAADTAGRLDLVVQGLTMPIDVGFDATGALYVLEFAHSQEPDQPYAPDSGRLLRIVAQGAPEVVLDRLNFPTALAFSPEGALYLAIGGAFTPAGRGAILLIPCRALVESEICPS